MGGGVLSEEVVQPEGLLGVVTPLGKSPSAGNALIPSGQTVNAVYAPSSWVVGTHTCAHSSMSDLRALK